MTRTLPASDYRKRPVTVKVAGPLSKDNCVAIARWCGGWTHIANTLVIPTLEGDMHASFGDWIIQGVAGEFYPCKPEIFAKTYEPATAHETTPSDAAIAQAFREALEDKGKNFVSCLKLIEERAHEIEQGRGAVDGKAIERAVMADRERPCLYGVVGPCQHPNCLESHYKTLYGEACRRMGNAKRELSACECGNDFIEIFGDDISGWWVGCKPCSRAGLHNHSKHAIRAQAVSHWNSCMGNRDE